jgi:hypothetical protein
LIPLHCHTTNPTFNQTQVQSIEFRSRPATVAPAINPASPNPRSPQAEFNSPAASASSARLTIAVPSALAQKLRTLTRPPSSSGSYVPLRYLGSLLFKTGSALSVQLAASRERLRCTRRSLRRLPILRLNAASVWSNSCLSRYDEMRNSRIRYKAPRSRCLWSSRTKRFETLV